MEADGTLRLFVPAASGGKIPEFHGIADVPDRGAEGLLTKAAAFGGICGTNTGRIDLEYDSRRSFTNEHDAVYVDPRLACRVDENPSVFTLSGHAPLPPGQVDRLERVDRSS